MNAAVKTIATTSTSSAELMRRYASGPEPERQSQNVDRGQQRADDHGAV